MSIPGPSRIPHVPPEPSLDALVPSLPAMMTISLGVIVVLSFVVMTSGKAKPPLANLPRWYQTALFKRLEFQQNGRAIMSEARRRYGKQLYRLITDTSECLILPPEYAATIRNSMDLSFAEAVVRVRCLIQSTHDVGAHQVLDVFWTCAWLRNVRCPATRETTGTNRCDETTHQILE
jgi:hypothetical protein